MFDKLHSLPAVIRILNHDVYHISLAYAKGSSLPEDVKVDAKSPEIKASAEYIQQALDLMREDILRRASDLAYADARDGARRKKS